jgi:hypothetical protein
MGLLCFWPGLEKNGGVDCLFGVGKVSSPLPICFFVHDKAYSPLFLP